MFYIWSGWLADVSTDYDQYDLRTLTKERIRESLEIRYSIVRGRKEKLKPPKERK